MMKKILLGFAVTIISFFVWAQENTNDVSMASTMRSNGKIYVVIAVILTIFAGIIFYLIRLERKIKKLENQNNNYK
ncbi:MAG: CcmD family protein [Chitinophagaceae bacterium]